VNKNLLLTVNTGVLISVIGAVVVYKLKTSGVLARLSVNTMNSEKFNVVQTLITGAFLATFSWNIFTTYELIKNQTLPLWRVEQLEKVPN